LRQSPAEAALRLYGPAGLLHAIGVPMSEIRSCRVTVVWRAIS
jgi:hypothetical protein